ncbi:hypothetical protein EDB80DRAFT_880378 [Ilyonectria destructans]|nr:hypothetical protein EDB80DRAFT_880378 [Ilyonectria destructans]
MAIKDESNIVVDTTARKVSFHTKSHSNTAAGEYKNEYAFTLSMTKDGKKLEEVIEFIDSLYLSRFTENYDLEKEARLWKDSLKMNMVKR